MNEDSRGTAMTTSSSGTRLKPLFPAAAAGSLFPIEKSQSQDKAEGSQIDSKAEKAIPIVPQQVKENEDLANLKLEIDPSTLDAIIAVQKPNFSEQCTLELNRDFRSNNVTDSISEELPQYSKKRKSPASDKDSQEDDLYQNKSSKSKDGRKKKKKKEKNKKRRHRSRSRSQEKSNDKRQFKIPSGAVFLEDIPGLEPQHAYHIDRKSNQDLWTYKSVSSRHIATYKSQSHNCLGAPHISVKESKKPKNKSNSWRYFDKENRKRIRTKGFDLLSEKTKTLSTMPNYIALSTQPASDYRKETIGSYSCLDSATKMYSEGKGIDYSQPLVASGDNFEMDEIFEKVRSFNQRTREHPHDVQMWLQFVKFQDVVAQEDKSFKGRTIKLREVYTPSKSVIEKKLSILDKAIEANPSSLDLKLAQLELYQDIWEADKLEKAWQNLLFTHSSDVNLWRQYISNQQSRLFKFNFSNIVKCYHKCFQTLVPIHEGRVQVVNKCENMENKIIGLFSQYCDFLHLAGYTERAVSSYQALIELNLFCPPALNLSSTKERVSLLEEFWESGVPRFGEQKAKGWAKWHDKQTSETDVPSSSSVNTDELEDAILLEKLPRSQIWLKLEKLRQNAHWVPWKPDRAKGETEESCEDLDRLVIFDDISPAMFRLNQSESCIFIVCLFLKLLGLSCETLDRRLSDLDESGSSLKFEQYCRSGLGQFPALAEIKAEIDIESKWKPHESLVAFAQEVLLQAESYFSLSNRNLFTLLRLELEVLKSETTKVSNLSKPSVKSIKKFGKALLKESQNRSNLVVWDTYIRLLWACSDNMAETVSMLDVALGMFMGASTFSEPENALGLCLLCRTYCQIMLNFEPLEHMCSHASKNCPPTIEDKHQVIACLGALIEQKSFKPNARVTISPAYILKLHKRFENNLEEFYQKLKKNTNDINCDFFVSFVEIFALFEFCASNFSSANNIFSSAVKRVRDISETTKTSVHLRLIKHLYMNQILFITNVRQILTIPLSHTRTVLSEALCEFPNCSQFHATFLQIESGAHIAGRLRKFYDKNLQCSTSVVVPLFTVMSELMRHRAFINSLDLGDYQQVGVSDSGIVYRIRSLLERCVQLPASSHCPLLWRLYLNFEAKYGQLNQAKGIFYRALQSCPWAKCIYLDGISIFGDGELQEVMDLMIEEEIRVRIPLEEVELLLTAEKQEMVADEQGEITSEKDGGDELTEEMRSQFMNQEDITIKVEQEAVSND
ncbi:unnamed protein product [Lymnaea stagnalis]|uniref:Protein NRDE2 homolog n=1 Tax=Lymnaea stagnalis TaxID=6523 RepID=A0AAV2H1H1_LYMST